MSSKEHSEFRMKTIDLDNGVKCRIDTDSSKCWYLNGEYHRTDGPAVENADGSKYWYLHDKLHRTDGPAVEYAGGYKAWYYEGKHIICQSTQEFQRLIRLKAFW
jgi:hypothetical protein